MRRFELSNEEHNKFWECRVEGTDFIVQYGRIGTDGQSNTKSFDAVEDAEAQMAKKIAEKTREGYTEV